MVRSMTKPIIFPRIDDSHFDRILSSLTVSHCFDDGYVGKQLGFGRKLCGALVKKKKKKKKKKSRKVWVGVLAAGLNNVESGVKHHTINQ